MKRTFAILAVAVLMISPIMMAGVDADETESKTIRWSQMPLYHLTGVAEYPQDIYQTDVWIYEKGQDGSMKAYINDPQTKTPDKGLRHVEEGRTYEVYCLSSDGVDGFSGRPAKVLSEYSYEIHVQKNTVKKLKVLDIRGGDQSYNRFDLVTKYSTESVSTSYQVNQVVNLYYGSDIQHYAFSPYYTQHCLYYEADIELSERESIGSPYVYVALFVCITAAVGFLIFWCGRKPKL